MTRRRGSILKMMVCALTTLGLALGVVVLTPSAAAHPRTSDGGPCSPITAQDLKQPGITPAGNASAWLDRTRGTYGTLLTLSGSGWPANAHVSMSAVVDGDQQLWYRGGNIASASTTASGEIPPTQFRLFSICPDLAPNLPQPGSVTVVLLIQTDPVNGQSPSTRQRIIFTYVQAPSVTAATVDHGMQSDVHAGDSVPFTAAGWAPGEQFTISSVVSAWGTISNRWGAAPLPLSPPNTIDTFTVAADSNGEVRFDYHVPDVAPDSALSLWVHASDQRFGDIGFMADAYYFVLPKIMPSLLIDTTTTVAGGTLYIAGDHWLPNQQVDIEYCRGQTHEPGGERQLYCNQGTAQKLVWFQADSTGHFYMKAQLPLNARLGPITVQARIDTADIFAGGPFTDAQKDSLAQGRPVTIVAAAQSLTYEQVHPLRAWVVRYVWYLGGVALALLAAAWGIVRWRRLSATRTNPA